MTQKTSPQPDGCRADSLTGPARQVHQAVPVTIIAAEPGTGRIITVHADSSRAAQAWARRHPEVTGRLLTQDGALAIGIAEFGSLLQAVPQPAAPPTTTLE